MNRRSFIKVSYALGAAGALARSRPGSSLPEVVDSSKRPLPNFVFLISDDQSCPDAGCYGNKFLHTPNIDRLAREGMRFDCTFAPAPSCSPSRSAILTGESPRETGTSRFHSPMPVGQMTILEYLKIRGYYTGAFKKVHQGLEFWNRWDFQGHHLPIETFFDRRPKDRPFYLHIGYHDPHRPYLPGERYPAHNTRSEVVDPGFLPDTSGIRRDLAHYYEAIERLDLRVGKFLELLDERGLAENTLLIFTSDQGMSFPGAKGTLYDPGLRVPLIARWPGKIRPGRSSSELISLVDLAPTWIEAAGIRIPKTMNGTSFLGLLTEGKYQPREEIYAERNYHTHLDFIRCVRTGRYKLIHNFLPEESYRPLSDIARSPSWRSIEHLHHDGKLTPALTRKYFGKPRPEVEFYDLEKDPWELGNLAGNSAYSETIRKLQAKLSRWMIRTHDFLPPPIEPIPLDILTE
ncbi:MAG: sulfatase [Acidobacteria bacterium]|nr:sulfatase [Acidobacteriota bacterium]